MAKSLIQDLLKAELLQIPDSEERLKDVESAVAALQDRLGEEKALVPECTRLALDPYIDEDNHVLESTEELLVERWKTLRAGIKQRPIPILRAIILEALYQAGQKDPVIARIIYLAASNFYSFARLGRERDLIYRFLEEMATFAEEDAAKEWTLVEEEPELQLPALQLHGLVFSAINIDQNNLKDRLVASIGPDQNGHTVQNNTPNWRNHFGDTAASAIADSIRNALQNFSGALSPDSIQTPVNNFFNAFRTSLNDTLQAALRPIYAVERRSRLLWWKETLYSPRLKQSYRTVASAIQPIILAFDLSGMLPPIVPASVDHLLIDTLQLLNPSASETRPIGDLLTALIEGKTILGKYLSEVQSGEGRISIIEFIASLHGKKASLSTLQERTGIPGDSLVSLTDLAVMTLHDLMIQRLIDE